MSAVASGLLPIFALIGIGYGLRRAKFVERSVWAGLERLIYFVLFPALLVHRLATADFATLPLGALALAVILAVLVVSALAAALRRPLALDGPRHAIVFMTASRFNTYVGIAAAEALWGGAGAAAAAVLLAVWVPLVNVLSIVVLLRHGERPWTGAIRARAVREVARNPIVLACLLGTALGWSGIGLPWSSDRPLALAAAAALPLGLLAVGAGLEFATVGARRRPLAIAVAAKLALMPAVMLATATLVGLDARTAAVAVLFAALPASPAAYVMTRQLGGDGPLMAGAIVATTLVSALSLPAWIAVAA